MNTADLQQLRRRPSTARALWKALRPRHWLKNLLVFVPMLAGHAINPQTALQSLVAFVAFCLCAWHGWLLSLAVGIYFAATVAYSVYLKRLLMVDTVMLALLHTLRVLGGCAATRIEPSFWLLAFSFFLFLSLALLKRHSELFNLDRAGKQKTSGRGYTTADRQPIGMMGMNSAFVAVVIFMLYFNSDNVLRLYKHPAWLFGIVPLVMLWLGRLWVLSFWGEVNEDPLLYVRGTRSACW